MNEENSVKRKVCRKCNLHLLLDEFCLDSHYADGCRPVCKTCERDPNHPSQKVGRNKVWRR